MKSINNLSLVKLWANFRQ